MPEEEEEDVEVLGVVGMKAGNEECTAADEGDVDDDDVVANTSPTPPARTAPPGKPPMDPDTARELAAETAAIIPAGEPRGISPCMNGGIRGINSGMGGGCGGALLSFNCFAELPSPALLRRGLRFRLWISFFTIERGRFTYKYRNLH